MMRQLLQKSWDACRAKLNEVPTTTILAAHAVWSVVQSEDRARLACPRILRFETRAEAEAWVRGE